MTQPDREINEKINNVLNQSTDFGWVIIPKMTKNEFKYLEESCNRYGNGRMKEKDFVNELNGILEKTAFHPNYRSYYVSRTKDLPHFSKYSHHIERAIFQYYKEDYLSVVMLLIPLIEGILLSYDGWDFEENKGDRKGTENYIKNFEEGELEYNAPPLQERRNIYGKHLAHLLRHRIFAGTEKPDLTFEHTVLNRHYIAHLLGTEHFYSKDDCHRLFALFDLMSEIIMLEENIIENFIPSDEETINERRSYYLGLIKENLGHRNCMEIENYLLNQHENYHSGDSKCNLTDETKDIFADLQKFYGQSFEKDE